MHGYRYPAHEARVAALARAAGFEQVSASHANARDGLEASGVASTYEELLRRYGR